MKLFLLNKMKNSIVLVAAAKDNNKIGDGRFIVNEGEEFNGLSYAKILEEINKNGFVIL